MLSYFFGPSPDIDLHKKAEFPKPDRELRSSVEQVDYFSYHFDSQDLHATWKRATHHKKHYLFQGSRRENIMWRRYKLQYAKDSVRRRVERPKFKVIGSNFGFELLGPFFSADQYCEDHPAIQSFYTKRPESLPLIIQDQPYRKPSLKRKFVPRDYIAKIKTSYSNSGLPEPNSPRRLYSDAALIEQSKSPHAFAGRKGLNSGEYAAPKTPKDLALQFLSAGEESHPRTEKHISFNSIVDEKVLSPISQSSDPRWSQTAFAEIVFQVEIQRKQKAVMAEIEFQRKQTALYKIQNHKATAAKIIREDLEAQKQVEFDATTQKVPAAELEVEKEKERQEEKKENARFIHGSEFQELVHDILIEGAETPRMGGIFEHVLAVKSLVSLW